MAIREIENIEVKHIIVTENGNEVENYFLVEVTHSRKDNQRIEISPQGFQILKEKLGYAPLKT